MESDDRGHLDALVLVELARGGLDAAREREARHHCLVCDRCARQVRALLLLRSGPGLHVPISARQAVQGLVPAAGRGH